MDPARTATGPLSRPVRVDPILRTIRITAITPCYNRPQDLALLASDLARSTLHAQLAREHLAIDLSVLVIDNASSPPLEPPALPPHMPTRLVRLAANTGGSGGFNAGMAIALGGDTACGANPDYLWLVDSDARVEADTLAKLLVAMEADPGLVAVGPALADTIDGRIHEIGGRVDRRTGRFGPACIDARGDAPIECDYVAACCALVRADAVRRAGLMPEAFLNGDDVEWCIRLARESGGRIAALPRARGAHPRFDRFATLARYFGARNAFGPIDALGLGRVVRFRRAMHEGARAANQHLMARPDLAALHMRGLRDAARGITRGLPADLPRTEPFLPLEGLHAAVHEPPACSLLIDWPRDTPPAERELVSRKLRERGHDPDAAARAPTRSIAAFIRRALAGPRCDLAVVSAKGSPAHWLVGRTMVELGPGGFVVRRRARWALLARAGGALAEGALLAARIALAGSARRPLPRPDDTRALAPIDGRSTGTLSVVVLSYNRKDALLQTLRRLHDAPATRGAEVIVVDNASTDGSPEAIRERAPWARLVALDRNEAIAGFNRGAEIASGECLLILDDDARPDPGDLAAAIDLLGRRPDLGAVTLLPVHPATGDSEWPFADHLRGSRDDWPVMGCCNLVRRAVWRAVGGYEGRFFLYRNDTDLALKILAAGCGVHFNPAWECEHDSPAAASKSPRWCRLATRNWIWLARRHGRGAGALAGALLGWAWAHRLSGLSPGRHWSTLRGAIEGIACRPPTLPPTVQPDGRAFARLLRLRFARPFLPQMDTDEHG